MCELCDILDDEMFFTPPTSPNSASSSDDDLFSSQSGTTTSMSSYSDHSEDRNVRRFQPVDVMSKVRSRRSCSEPMSALMEEDEDEDSVRPRTVSSRVTIPTPLPVSAGRPASSGYTSLTLPRAAYTPTKHRVSTSVDITLSGLAQTTMATISISTRPRPPIPDHLRSSLPSPLAFTSHTPPPTKVHARQVLVQVFAVAVDSLDALIVRDRASRNDGLGFVPGRSLVGRAVETGWEVTNVVRGDWVIAITDIRKCGALAEFIVVDRRRLHAAPRPSSSLSLEQMAILPLAGIPAHRAVRTFAHLPRQDARTLILNAHQGPGLLATQELAALGLPVIAHVPMPWGSAAEARARAAGAPDVRCDDPTEILNSIPPAQLAGVLDTVGGKQIWAAARTALRPAGQFTTLVGDAVGATSPHAHFRSTMRALFAQRVGYQWVSPVADVDSDGADIRDTLAAVVRLAADGIFRPHVARVVPLERAPDEAFADLTGTVVRIVG